MKQTPDQLAAYLEANGSSINSLRRQIEGEIAWQRLQRAKIESGVSVGDDEVKAVLDKLNASKGTEEYHVGEIFLSATPGDAGADARQCQQDPRAAAQRRLLRRLCAAIFGSLDGGGRRRPRLGPARAAARRRSPTRFAQMAPGTVSNPIPVPGGVSIIAVQDTRKILTPIRATRCSASSRSRSPSRRARRAQLAEPIVARFAEAAQNVGGCGGADKIAADFHGEVVSSDQVKMRDLPPALQQMMLPMQVGQATQPFGSLEEGVRVLVICGRDEVDSDRAELRRRLQPAQRGAGQHRAPGATCATCAATR